MAAYLAGSWAVVESFAFFQDRYGWPDPILDAMVLGLIAGFLPVLILTWRHGLPGEQRWMKTEILAALSAFLVVGALGVETGVLEKTKGLRRRGKGRLQLHIEKLGESDHEGLQKTVTMRSKAQPLGRVMHAFAKHAHLNSSVAEPIRQRKVTVMLKEVSFEEALVIIARQTNTEIQLVGNTLEVLPKSFQETGSSDAADAASPASTPSESSP